MGRAGIDYREIYDKEWQAQSGPEDFGDRELSRLFIEKTRLLKQGQAILEIGCALGKLCNELHEMGYRRITGVDIAPSKIAVGKERFPHLDLRSMDAAALDFPADSFDTCLSFDVIEHLPDVDRHLREVWRVLKPGGQYMLQTPNRLSNSVFETLRSRGVGWRLYHPSLQSPWSLRRKMLSAGFATVEFVKIPPASEFKIRQIPRGVRWLFRGLPWKRLPLFLQVGLFVVARKPGLSVSASPGG